MMNEYLDLSPYDGNWKHFNHIGKTGVHIHYVRMGAGEPVLFLHGWPGFWYDWRHVLPELSKSCDVIAPDLRGFGKSGKPEELPAVAYTPENHVDDLIGLIHSLSLDKVVVVAHDIGATIAQTLVKKFPERVKSLVLLNPPYGGIGERRFDPNIQSEFWYQHFHNLPIAEEILGLSDASLRVYLTYFYEHWIGNREKLREQELNYIIEEFLKPGAFKASIAYYRARSGAKTSSALSSQIIEKISHKTTILWGNADPVIRYEWADRIPDYFSDATITILNNIGHFVPFEAPLDVIKAVKEHV
ncbi:alpha/beta hydrolase [Bacillus sp. JJ1503]|uniref:alpha/beta fold hydrolase n=1 Tax=unclassified Bacillus (in: firmicutes) TaxID=185979 RepID=UPI0030001BED